MFMLHTQHLADDTCCLRRLSDRGKGCVAMGLHALLVPSRGILDHLRVDREHVKRRQHRQRVTRAPIWRAKVMPC